MLIVSEQLDELIGYTSRRNNISKNLLAKEWGAVDVRKEKRPTKTDSFFFAGS